ncbi:J domain-containing protein [Winogradskyella sp. PG-2]|uniref:J domain-containing protein n=1 Tax=Winogradskyella sp. PG-2 TaxID=754409 RepID=UPI00045866B3|nr:DnaJ domain-containing protein [Winogradskyella sp. PG-2]BAO74244.1 chaperone protein DnaJ [Winogradskyella sp. PG-2]
MITNYYTLLKIEQSTTLYDIKKAFRREIAIYHPDNNKSEDAKDKFESLVEAFDVLSDTEKRKTYDELLNYQAKTCKPVVTEEQKEVYEEWQKEAKTKSKTYRKSTLTELLLLDIFAEASIEGLFVGTESLIEGAEPLIDGIGDVLGDVIGGIFDDL